MIQGTQQLISVSRLESVRLMLLFVPFKLTRVGVEPTVTGISRSPLGRGGVSRCLAALVIRPWRDEWADTISVTAPSRTFPVYLSIAPLCREEFFLRQTSFAGKNKMRVTSRWGFHPTSPAYEAGTPFLEPGHFPYIAACIFTRRIGLPRGFREVLAPEFSKLQCAPFVTLVYRQIFPPSRKKSCELKFTAFLTL